MSGVAEALRNWLFAGAQVSEATPGTRSQITRVIQNRRLTSAGHLSLAALVLCLAGASYMLARIEAHKRVDRMGYCQRVPLKLEKPLKFPVAETSIILGSALPTATRLQQQRLIQQGKELLVLYTYHCRSLQAFSSNYQALLSVANASAVVSATILAILSVYGLKGEINWPFTVLASSAFTLGLSMTSIQTFKLSSNLIVSRSLVEQTNALTRSFATSLANQTYADSRRTLNLANQQDLGAFINAMDQRIKQIDVPSFAMEDRFAAREAQLLLNRSTKPEGQPPSESN
ncbi:MAG: hypothetical protein ACKOZW_05210 [Cyanobium sp.]